MNAIATQKKLFKTAEDVVMHIAALTLVARADGVLHDAERSAIIGIANQHSKAIPGYDTFNDLMESVEIEGDTAKDRRNTIKNWMSDLAVRKENICIVRGLLVDMIMLGHCDGEYAESEKELIREFAKHLGVSDSVLVSLENSCEAIIAEMEALQKKINGIEETSSKKARMEVEECEMS